MDAVRSKLRGVAQVTLKRTAAGLDRLRPPTRGVIVLLYHRVGRRRAVELDLELDRFAEQMAILADCGRVCSLDDALDVLEGRRPTPALDPVVVTFDDGTTDFVDDALPVLAEHGIPATLYVATAFVDDQRDFPDAGRPLSWAALGDACSTGLVQVGSHTHSHALLDRLAPQLAADELDRSIERIEDQ